MVFDGLYVNIRIDQQIRLQDRIGMRLSPVLLQAVLEMDFDPKLALATARRLQGDQESVAWLPKVREVATTQLSYIEGQLRRLGNILESLKAEQEK